MKSLIAILVLCSGITLSQTDTSKVWLSRDHYKSIIETLEKIVPYFENEIDCTLLYKKPEQMYREMADKLVQREKDIQEFKVLLWWFKSLAK